MFFYYSVAKMEYLPHAHLLFIHFNLLQHCLDIQKHMQTSFYRANSVLHQNTNEAEGLCDLFDVLYNMFES